MSKPVYEAYFLDLADAEIRDDSESGRPVIKGRAIVYNVLSKDLGGFREIIRPGAAATALDGADVVAFADHDRTRLLGRRGAGTLRLIDGPDALRYEIDPPDTSYVRDLRENMRIGNIAGSSFQFGMWPNSLRGQKWERRSDGVVREITEFRRIVEVSVVSSPAYLETDASLAFRAFEEFQRSEVETMGNALAGRGRVALMRQGMAEIDAGLFGNRS